MPSNYLKLRIKNDMGTVGTPSAILGVCSSERISAYVFYGGYKIKEYLTFVVRSVVVGFSALMSRKGINDTN